MNFPNKAQLPSDEKLAQAILMMKQHNNDLSTMAMFLVSDNDKDNSNQYADLLKYYQNGNKAVSPEMIKYSMMQTMFPSF